MDSLTGIWRSPDKDGSVSIPIDEVETLSSASPEKILQASTSTANSSQLDFEKQPRMTKKVRLSPAYNRKLFPYARRSTAQLTKFSTSNSTSQGSPSLRSCLPSLQTCMEEARWSSSSSQSLRHDQRSSRNLDVLEWIRFGNYASQDCRSYSHWSFVHRSQSTFRCVSLCLKRVIACASGKTDGMLDRLATMERVLTTPLPFAYNIHRELFCSPSSKVRKLSLTALSHVSSRRDLHLPSPPSLPSLLIARLPHDRCRICICCKCTSAVSHPLRRLRASNPCRPFSSDSSNLVLNSNNLSDTTLTTSTSITTAHSSLPSSTRSLLIPNLLPQLSFGHAKTTLSCQATRDRQ